MLVKQHNIIIIPLKKNQSNFHCNMKTHIYIYKLNAAIFEEIHAGASNGSQTTQYNNNSTKKPIKLSLLHENPYI